MARARNLQTGSLSLLSQNLARLRAFRGLSQFELAGRAGLTQAQISYFETDRRRPTLSQLTTLARALEVPLQDFLGHASRENLSEIVFELRNLGIIDLKAGGAGPPSAFRPAEQIIALTLSGDEPESRIIEAIPAVLAWNPIDPRLLKAYAVRSDRRALHRAAWLADVALAIDKSQGFPGGIRRRRQLSSIAKFAKPPRESDSLGRPAGRTLLPPIWRKWKITYAGDLSAFRSRATALEAAIRNNNFWKSFFESRRTVPPAWTRMGR
jgi:transcriptional regulator with XRE-family HTH domain